MAYSRCLKGIDTLPLTGNQAVNPDQCGIQSRIDSDGDSEAAGSRLTKQPLASLASHAGQATRFEIALGHTTP